MSDDEINLACRAVNCAGWRWLPGMRDLDGGMIGPDGGFLMYDEDEYAWREGGIGDDRLPDLSHPGTLGGLLHLVREAWGACMDTAEFLTHTGLRQFVVRLHSCDDAPEFQGGSLPSALVAALEAAPC